MKKTPIVLLALVFLCACQKEIDWDLKTFDLSKLFGKTWSYGTRTAYPSSRMTFFTPDTGHFSALTWYSPPDIQYTNSTFTWNFKEPDTLVMSMSSGIYKYNIIRLEDTLMVLKPAIAGVTDTQLYTAY
jgi:hypothetical protein